MEIETSSLFTLWWAVIISGIYHGINPGMGWPLAVSAALMERKHIALFKALLLLSAGHLLAMLTILLPFSLMSSLMIWEKELRIAAGVIVCVMGIYLFFNRKHPKFLARVHPARLALWSFLAAWAHGAGLMLLPIYLGICSTTTSEGHLAASTLMSNNIGNAILVSSAHSLAMIIAGGLIALLIYLWLGLRFLSKTWFNLDMLWAISLIIVGSVSIYFAYIGH